MQRKERGNGGICLTSLLIFMSFLSMIRAVLLEMQCFVGLRLGFEVLLKKRKWRTREVEDVSWI